MFPLKNKKITGYKFGVKTFYNDFHVGVDYGKENEEILAPFDGLVTTSVGNEGGKTIFFKPNGKQELIRLLHLKEFKKTGTVKQGELIGIVGHTGLVSPPGIAGSHTHLDISKNGRLELNKKSNFLDPEKYNWEESLNKTFMKVTIIANKIAWNYKAQLPKITEWFKTYSNNRLEVVFDTKETNFDTVPLAPFADKQSVDVNWYRENITPLATGEATVLLLNPNQYQIGGIWGFMTYGDPNKPVRMEVACTDEPNFPEAHLLVHRVFHEICHALYFLTGQPDRVHELLLVENPAPNRTVLLNEIDYTKLQAKLITIKPMSKIKIRQIGWTDAEKGIYVGFDTPATRDEIISKINSILPKYELDGTKEYNLGKRPF